MQESSLKNELIVLENNKISLHLLKKNNGPVYALIDKSSGFDFIRDKKYIKDLFTLELRSINNHKPQILYSSNAVKFDFSKGENKLVLNYSFVSDKKINVQIDIRLEKKPSFLKMKFKIENKEKEYYISNITCPILSSISKLGESVEGETIATGFNGEGYLFKNPFPVVDNLPLKMGKSFGHKETGVGEFHNIYPGKQQMQFVLFYNDLAGLYIATYDSKQNVKSFDLGAKDGYGNNPLFSITHYFEAEKKEHKSIEYETVLGVFAGKWHEGADIYKKWAQKQWWCSKKLIDKNIPDWFKKGFGVFQMSNYHQLDLSKVNHSLDKIANTVNDISNGLNNASLLGLIFNFEAKGAWTGPIGLLPPREGNKNFKGSMDKLNQKGNQGFVYIPGGTWYLHIPFKQKNFDSWNVFKTEALDSAIKKEDGEIIIESWFPQWQGTRICPSTSYTKNVTKNMFLGCLDIGATAVQIDNFPICGVTPCYNRDHGHPLGYGAWWSEEWNNILEEIRLESKKKNRQSIMTTEGISENFILYLDMYDNRTGNTEYFCHLEKDLPYGAEVIPLFNYIYNEYIGSYTAAYPECNRPETKYWIRNLGKSLAQGVVPTGGWYYPNPDKLNSKTIKFYKKIIDFAANYCWKYIMFGKMLKPIEINVPQIEMPAMQMFDPENNTGEVDKEIFFISEKAIQHSVWKASDGDVGYIFINISKEKIKLSTTIDQAGFKKKSKYSISEINDGIKGMLYKNVGLPQKLELEIEPLSTLLVEVKEN